MRLKLKSDTFFIPMGDNLYLRNNEKSMAMKGKALANWLERLSPLLDGQHDLTDICQTFPEGKRPLLRQFLLALVEHGYLKDSENDLPHTLPAEMIAAYGPAITFIEAHIDSGASRFQRFLTLPVLAIASGECLLALAHTLLETGNRAVVLLDTGEETTSYERLEEILVLQRERDRDLRYTLLKRDVWQNEAELLHHCAAASTVLYFSTAASLDAVARLARYCQAAGTSFLPAVVLGSEIHIGPFHHSGDAGCWQCYWRRYQAARGLPAYAEEDTLVSPARTSASVCIGKPAIGIVANMQSFEFFKYGTGERKNTLDAMICVLELERLQIVKHQLFPHPLCPCCSPQHIDLSSRQVALDAIAQLIQETTRDFPQEEQQSEKLIDRNSGIFALIDDMDLYQLPLIRSRIEVTQSSDEAYSLPIIQAAGLDYAEVRINMVRQAAGRYQASLADPRRTCLGTYRQFKYKAVRPEWISGWCGRPREENTNVLAWIWGVQITTELDLLPILLPGAAIAPYSRWNRDSAGPLFNPDMGMTSVATTWPQALAEGLSGLSLTIFTPASEAQGLQIERAAYSSDAICAAYLDMLDILGEQIVLVDCAPIYGIPYIAIYLNQRFLGYFSHWNTLCAIRQALQQAVLTIQVQRTPGSEERMEHLDESKEL
ncbi:MAG TPA: TOMM precursor leader peptide-binding protein, partial [Ktedonobacteraceae bacterium]|nr:TOMM precursor leader peptide-binding protein [Ktedonobacteraceae bacterium]